LKFELIIIIMEGRVCQHKYMLSRIESIQMDDQDINTTVQARALLGSLRFCLFHCVYSL